MGRFFGHSALRMTKGSETDMDNAKIFDTLERKIEKLLSRLSTLEGENAKLKSDLAAARKAEKEAGDSRGAVERLEKDQEVVRERLEKLIASLEAAEKS
jgi:outer membrane murein-binding lipoprotein Lpp